MKYKDFILSYKKILDYWQINNKKFKKIIQMFPQEKNIPFLFELFKIQQQNALLFNKLLVYFKQNHENYEALKSQF